MLKSALILICHFPLKNILIQLVLFFLMADVFTIQSAHNMKFEKFLLVSLFCGRAIRELFVFLFLRNINKSFSGLFFVISQLASPDI